MRFSLLSAVLLCFTTWMVHATHTPVSTCCPRWSTTQIKFENILDYTIQSESVCEIPAVAFHTKHGRTICSDPNSRWAKKAIQTVDEEKKKITALQEKEQNEEGSASIITPAVSSTSKKTPQPQKKGRNGRRRQRKCRGGRKGQRKHV